MLFKSALITQGSGSVGGFTVFTSRSGLAMRARAIPTNPGSDDQVDRRSAFGSLSAAWSGLTADQRTQWSWYASVTPVTNRLGDTIYLTGHQMYVRCNCLRSIAGLAIVDDGPETPGTVPTGSPKAATSAATSVVTVTWSGTPIWDADALGGLLVFCSTDRGQGIESFKGPYLYAGIILGDDTTPPTSPDVSITSPYNHFVGNNGFYAFRACTPDGRISGLVRVGPKAITA